MRSAIVVVLAVSLILPPSAFADCKLRGPVKPTCNPDDPTKCSQPVCAGHVAQIDGQVLSTPLAIDIGQRAADADARVVREVQFAVTATTTWWRGERDKARADTNAERGKAEWLERRLVLTEKDRDAWKDAAEQSWYESPALWIGVGIVLTVVLVAVLDYERAAVDKATR